MSWSVSAVGKPAAVKASLAKQFESAKQSTKQMPHENAAVGNVEAIVNGELDFLGQCANASAVTVSASGSAYRSTDGSGSTQVKLEVSPIYGFVE